MYSKIDISKENSPKETVSLEVTKHRNSSCTQCLRRIYDMQLQFLKSCHESGSNSLKDTIRLFCLSAKPFPNVTRVERNRLVWFRLSTQEWNRRNFYPIPFWSLPILLRNLTNADCVVTRESLFTGTTYKRLYYFYMYRHQARKHRQRIMFSKSLHCTSNRWPTTQLVKEFQWTFVSITIYELLK